MMNQRVDVTEAAVARALVDMLPGALVAIAPSGEVVHWSEGAAALFGFGLDEVLGRPLEQLTIPPDACEVARRALAEAMRSGSTAFETIRRRKDGTPLEVEVTMRAVRDGHGGIQFVAVHERDLNAPKRPREVRSQEATFRALLEATPDAMIVADGEGRIQVVNSRMESLFGYRRQELLGLSVESLVPERYRVAYPSHRRPRVEQPRPRPAGGGDPAVFGRRKDGSEFPAEFSFSPVETDDGIMAITAIRDVSERQKAEDARATLYEAQEAIRVRDEFISIASHELRTPLTAGMLQVDSLLRFARLHDGPGLAEPILDRLRTIHRAMHRLDTLINQMLDLSRITAGRLTLQREKVDLSAATRNVVSLLHDELARAGCDLVLHADDPVYGSWDPLRVEQVLTNLLSNAMKYGQGKPIEVIVGSSDDDSATLTVRDHGIGIAPEDQARVFERFERILSERGYGGFGLGLWIVRQIVEAHGGTIRIFSEPGAGSTFTVELPQLATRSSTLPPSAKPRDPAKRCVMIVDDDALIRSTFADMLADVGFSVVTAENGLVALDMLRSGIRPRVIFLDLMMPVMDAWAFCAEQRKDQEFATIPVAVLSAADNLAERTRSLGAAACFRKPSDVSTLVRIAERFCG